MIEIEKFIVDCLLTDFNSCPEGGRIPSTEFEDNDCRMVIKAIQECREAKEEITIISISNHLENKSLVLSFDMGKFFTSEQFSDVVRKLLDRNKKKKLKASIMDAIKKIDDPRETYNDLVKEMNLSFVLDEGPGDLTPINRIQVSYGSYLPTGLSKFDKIIGGLPVGITVLGGKPGTGKTVLALQVAMSCEKPVAYFSLEMDKGALKKRMITKLTGYSAYQLSNPEFRHNYAESIDEAERYINSLPITIDDSKHRTPWQIYHQCKRLAQNGLGLIVIDYLQFLDPDSQMKDRRLEIEQISKTLTQLAQKELKVPCLLLSALSREYSKRQAGMPMISDLRECSGIEHDAELIMLLWSKDEEGISPTKEVSIIVGKNREGFMGIFQQTFDKGKITFSDPIADFTGGASVGVKSYPNYYEKEE
jgi:replicative DNA helicase